MSFTSCLNEAHISVLSATLSRPSIPKANRAVVWPGKNHKYFKKRKLNNEFQSFFLFNILLPEIHSDIKMLYNFVNSNMYKMFGQKKIYIF